MTDGVDWQRIVVQLRRALDRAIDGVMPSDPNPFPRFHLIGRRRR